MPRSAAILMFLAWLLYGAMPAVGMPYMQAASPAAVQDHSQHHDHGKAAAETAKAGHSHGPSQPPCPHGGRNCATPFCAACLTLLPELAIGGDGRFAHAYPSPAIEQALASPATAPLTPPPRG